MATLRSTAIHGIGLHSGLPSSVTLDPSEGPVGFRTEKGVVELAEVAVTRTDRGVRVAAPHIGLDVDGVEHLLAALGGLGIRRGVTLAVEGGEVPLVDGAAAVFAEALSAFGLPPEEPATAILRDDEIRVEDSTYRFSVGDAVKVEVTVDFAVPAIGVQSASWNGTKTAFVRDIAWARTFGFQRESETLRAAGRAHGVDPAHVMVLDDEGRVVRPYTPARPAEFARHKLLDLVGDLYLHGGPPSGCISATRPGHAATHRAVRLAVEREIIGPRPSATTL